MRILSFDVGVKNLAYCLIEVGDQDFTIIDWDIINLLCTTNTICEYSTKKGKCDKNATHTINQSVDNVHLCKTHMEKTEIAQKREFVVKKTDEGDKCSYGKCTKGTKWKTDDVLFCDAHKKIWLSKKNLLCKRVKCLNEAAVYVEDYGGWCEEHSCESLVYKKRKTKKIKNGGANMMTLGCLLYNALIAKHNVFLPCDNVVIENQPAFKNPKMKNIASMIFSHFLGVHISDKSVSNVVYCSAVNKLKVCGVKTKGLKKADAKKMAVKIVEQIITTHKENDRHFLQKHKKRDDLADALLQGLGFYYNKLPTKYEEVIAHLLREPKE